MELRLNPEQQARLHNLASRTGRNPEQMLKQALDHMLDYDERFLVAVEEGREFVRRGELLEHDQVVERIENILRF